jgi:hypothetical protein
MTVITNRPCIIGDRVYAEGDVVDNHDYAEKLLAFGFAEEVSEPPAPDPAPAKVDTPKAHKAATEEEQ